MRLHFQAEARHANRVLYTLLPVDNIASWYHMDHLAMRGNGDSSRNLDCPADVVLYNIPVTRRDSHKSFAILRGNMAAGNPHIRCGYLLSCKAFCTIQSRCNGSDGLFYVHHHPPSQT